MIGTIKDENGKEVTKFTAGTAGEIFYKGFKYGVENPTFKGTLEILEIQKIETDLLVTIKLGK